MDSTEPTSTKRWQVGHRHIMVSRMVSVLLGCLGGASLFLWYGAPAAEHGTTSPYFFLLIAFVAVGSALLLEHGAHCLSWLVTYGLKVEKERETLALRVQRWLLQIEETNDRVVEAQTKAEKASTAKSDFLARMSHEIRTPMNGILGLTSLALDHCESAEQRENLELIRESGLTLLNIINDILDFSKIEAGRLTLKNEPMEPFPLVQRAVRLLRPVAEKRGVQITSTFEGVMPRVLLGDPVRLTQVLHNLAGNAIKFSSEGGLVEIALKAAIDPSEQKRMRVTFEVKDSGIGIPPADLERIFLPFEQVDAAQTNRPGGTGLGLAITRHLVELMGGALEVDSTVAVGTTFRFTVSLETVTHLGAVPKKESPPQGNSFAGRRALVAEDNVVNQKVIRKVLETMGFEVVIVGDGAQAVERHGTERFDVVILDCQMPVMDGYTAARTIRAEDPHEGAAVPLVALTAHAMPEDRARCLEAGMDAYLTKPIDRAQLGETLRTLLSPGT